MTEAIYVVTGMTCGHCVTAVTDMLTALDGVKNVNVDLTSGRVSVTSTAPLDDDLVRAALAETGDFELAGQA